MPVAYPSYPLLAESTDSRSDGGTTERATNGKLRRQVLYPADKRESMSAAHLVPIADGLALEAFYEANRTAELTIDWIDGKTVTAVFSAPPKITRYSKRWKVVMTLTEV